MVRSDEKERVFKHSLVATRCRGMLKQSPKLTTKVWSKETGKQGKLRSDVDGGWKNPFFTAENVCQTLAILLKPFLCVNDANNDHN